MKEPLLQAHRGVSTEYPENTMRAFRGAVRQGYGVIELDPAVTADGEIVILHDRTLNRTARRLDGTPLPEPLDIGQITLDEARRYDMGLWLDKRFCGERIPLLADALALAREHDVLVKLDNKIQRFDETARAAVVRLVRASGARVAFTCSEVGFARLWMEKLGDCSPAIEIHYDGMVTEEILQELLTFVPVERLCVWVPYRTALNGWARVEFANEALCAMVKRYARLGLWIIADYADYDDAVARFAPDIVETTGRIKPTAHTGVMADMHTHSHNSHDGKSPVGEMAATAGERGISVLAITDHYDVEYFKTTDLHGIAAASHGEVRATEAPEGVRILTGLEIGEGMWYSEVTASLIAEHPCDIVIGSVHAVRFEGYTRPYSGIDFSAMGREMAADFLESYLDDVLCMLRTTETDILPHLTCPLRYMNGKYGLGIDCRDERYRAGIEAILDYIITHAIALEVNTSCVGSSYDELMPESWIIERYVAKGGYLITCASDAHNPSRVGHEFDALKETLRSLGLRHTFYLIERDWVACAL